MSSQVFTNYSLSHGFPVPCSLFPSPCPGYICSRACSQLQISNMLQSWCQSCNCKLLLATTRLSLATNTSGAFEDFHMMEIQMQHNKIETWFTCDRLWDLHLETCFWKGYWLWLFNFLDWSECISIFLWHILHTKWQVSLVEHEHKPWSDWDLGLCGSGGQHAQALMVSNISASKIEDRTYRCDYVL